MPHTVHTIMVINCDSHCTKQNQTALLNAILMGHTNIVELLLSSGADHSDASVLVYAIYSKMYHVMEIILADNATDVNAVSDGYTALAMAIQNNDENAARMLLERNDLDVNVLLDELDQELKP